MSLTKRIGKTWESTIHKKKKAVITTTIFTNLKSYTMKNTMQR